MTRRAARAFVLAVFVAALLGPWDSRPRRSFVEWLLEDVASEPALYSALGAAGVLAVPLACLAGVLSPSRLSTAYRFVLTAAGCFFLPLIVVFFVAALGFGFPEEWGIVLYAVAIVLALMLELRRPRRPAERDYAEVFR